MDEETERAPALDAAAEERRRAVVLAELARKRRKRRWITGLSVLAVSAIVIAGSIIAWNSQGKAGWLARQIDAWHVEHDRAACELEERIVSAVGVQERTEDVLDAAEYVPSAEDLLGDRERASFAAQREELLRVLRDGGFVNDDDRALARAWDVRAAAAGDPESFDVLATCVADAEAAREPLADVTPEQVPGLERELRALGDPRDFDDARIDQLEAAIARLETTAVAVAESRADLATIETGFGLAPEQALASVRDADAHIRTVLAAVAESHSPGDVLDLVEALALHVAAGWMAEAWQLEAAGERDAAAARAAAAQASRDAIAQALPRPVTDPTQPAPARPPLSEPPPPPAETVEPPPVTPPAPPPVIPTTPPVTPEPGPSTPAPVDPPVPTTPGPEPVPEPEPGTSPGPAPAPAVPPGEESPPQPPAEGT
ncbi:MAG: hypothetical protein ACQEWM_09935 [Actinomycetota bacterium]